MSEYRLGVIEMRFAELIWQNAPVASGKLVRLAEEALGWKKSTTYTVLRRLCERGLFRNENGTVTVLLDRQTFLARQSEEFLEENFAGSLPDFLAAFAGRRRLSEKEIDEIIRIIRGGTEREEEK